MWLLTKREQFNDPNIVKALRANPALLAGKIGIDTIAEQAAKEAAGKKKEEDLARKARNKSEGRKVNKGAKADQSTCITGGEEGKEAT